MQFINVPNPYGWNNTLTKLVETDSKKPGQDQKLTTNKRSTIFDERDYLMASPFLPSFMMIAQNCRFFVVSHIFWQPAFLWISLYYVIYISDILPEIESKWWNERGKCQQLSQWTVVISAQLKFDYR